MTDKAAQSTLDAEGTVELTSLTLMIKDLPDDSRRLDSPEALAELAATPFVVIEGTQHRWKLEFTVRGGVAAGLRYTKQTKLEAAVHADDWLMGSFAPQETPHSFTTDTQEAPTGAAGRGDYKIIGTVFNDARSWEVSLPHAVTIIQG